MINNIISNKSLINAFLFYLHKINNTFEIYFNKSEKIRFPPLIKVLLNLNISLVIKNKKIIYF